MKTFSLNATTHNRIQIEEIRNGNVAFTLASKFITDKEYKKAADQLGIDVAQVYNLVNQFKANGAAQVIIADEDRSVRLYVRPMREPMATAREFASLQDVISTPLDMIDPIIQWDNRKGLAALDVDFHEYDHERRPDQNRLNAVAIKLRPVPFAFWLTRNRGMRFMYAAEGEFNADELAAVAAIHVREMEPGCTIEVNRTTRYPPGEVGFFTQTTDVTRLQSWFNETLFDPAEANDWLSKHGYVIGERYEHDKCPGRPDNRIARKPVVVFHDHIYCYLCNHYFSFASLVGRRAITSLRRAVSALTHWQHAQYMVEEFTGLTGEIAKLAYSAALKLANPDDSRIKAAFTAGTDLIRMPGHWITPRGESMRDSSLTQTLATLPACQNREGKPIASLCNIFTQPIDLSDYGYTSIMPIWGMRLNPRKSTSHDSYINVVMQNANFSNPNHSMYRPVYIPTAKRKLDESAAFSLLVDIFPGLFPNVVKLYLAGKGISDSENGPPVMAFISGPTSSGKTLSAHIAAAICADMVFPVRGITNEDRLREAIRTGKQQGSFILFDEIIKDARKEKGSIVDGLSFMLNLTPNSLSHRLFTGAVPLGRIPVCLFADTSVPIEVMKDAQLSRRLIHVHMPFRVEWEKTFKQAGGTKIEHLRFMSREINEACNVILSCVMDEFFQEDVSFIDVAERLGFKTLEHSEAATQSRDELLQFFEEVCKAPEIDRESDKRRWRGAGWKLIHRDITTPLTEAWESVCDGLSKDQYINSRKCTEVDWRQVIYAVDPVILDIYPHGMSRLAVRFRSITGGKQSQIVNERIPRRVHETYSLEFSANGNGVYRPGDTESPQSENGWIESLPNGSIHTTVESSGQGSE